jgi:hypothetical protein
MAEEPSAEQTGDCQLLCAAGATVPAAVESRVARLAYRATNVQSAFALDLDRGSTPAAPRPAGGEHRADDQQKARSRPEPCTPEPREVRWRIDLQLIVAAPADTRRAARGNERFGGRSAPSGVVLDAGTVAERASGLPAAGLANAALRFKTLGRHVARGQRCVACAGELPARLSQDRLEGPCATRRSHSPMSCPAAAGVSTGSG